MFYWNFPFAEEGLVSLPDASVGRSSKIVDSSESQIMDNTEDRSVCLDLVNNFLHHQASEA